MTKRDSGRKGGLATLERYGRGWLREQGKKGGRPRSLTYDDIRQRQCLGRNNNHKEAMGPPGKNLRTLKTELKLHRRSSGILETAQAGLAQETPREQVPAGEKAR